MIAIITVRFLIILISSVHLYYSTSVEQNSLFFNTVVFIILEKDVVIINRSLYEISQKLKFTIEPAKVDGALYCEPALNGFSTVTINRD